MRTPSKFDVNYDPELREATARIGELNAQEHVYWLNAIIDGQVSTPRAVTFLEAQYQHITGDVLVLSLSSMRERAIAKRKPRKQTVVNIAGTGGLRRPRYNISTAATFAAAATFCNEDSFQEGTLLLKLGNTGHSYGGSSDFLDLLGIPVSNLGIQNAESTMSTFGVGFLHFPAIFANVSRITAMRRLVQCPTIFNLMGPLSNWWANFHIIGLGDFDQLNPVIDALRMRGQGLIVHGVVPEHAMRFDELVPVGENTIIAVSNSGDLLSYSFSPTLDLNLPHLKAHELMPLRDIDPHVLIMGLSDGRLDPELLYFVAINAALTVFADGSRPFSVKALREGVDQVVRAIRSKKVSRLIRAYKDEFSE